MVDNRVPVLSDLPPAPLWVRFMNTVVRRLPLGRYRLIHLLSRKPPAPFVVALPPSVGGFRFACDLRDAMARDVCFTGVYEPQEAAIVRALLGSGMTLVDVGASWGYFTLLGASLVGEGGRVVALEPDPRSYALLEANVRGNGFTQVSTLELAASDRSGTLTLQGYDETGENFGLSRLVQTPAAGANVFQVATRALDDVLDEHGVHEIDLLKMDVEGAENSALAGLGRYLSEGKIARLLLELHPVQLAEAGVSPSHVVEQLTASGYRVWTIDHSPDATRRAAYARDLAAARLIRPHDDSHALDAWPHLLCVREGLDPV